MIHTHITYGQAVNILEAIGIWIVVLRVLRDVAAGFYR